LLRPPSATAPYQGLITAPAIGVCQLELNRPVRPLQGKPRTVSLDATQIRDELVGSSEAELTGAVSV
jgi:hypothetical protein